jgi:hypothetical protein
MNESIKGVFPIDVGGLSQWLMHYYDMYFTDRRIVANFTGRGIMARSTNKILIPIGGWIDWFIVRPMYKREKQEQSSDLENILKSDEHNFTWDYQKDIKSIEFKKHIGGLAAPPGMVITPIQGKSKTCVCRHKDFDSVKSILVEVSGEKII